MVKFVVLKRLCKYAASSFLSVGIDFTLLYLFVEFLGLHYLVAASISFVLGHSVNYFISRHWNFKHADRKHKVAYVMFVGFGAVSLGLTVYLLKIFVDDAGFNYINARIVAGVIVGLCNFLFNYYVTFKAHMVPEDIDNFHPSSKKRK